MEGLSVRHGAHARERFQSEPGLQGQVEDLILAGLPLKIRIDAQQLQWRRSPRTARTCGMAFVPSVAFFEACILYPFYLRNFVVQAAVDRLVESRWTDDDEWIRNLAANVPAIPVERPKNTCQLMNDALPSATVVSYENHIEAMRLPDPNDRPVLAAGIAAGATVILTWNLRHFPAKELKTFGRPAKTAKF